MHIPDLYSIFLKSTGVSTDTRTVSKGNLFFCLKGENFDGNTFAQKAIQQGASFVVVDDPEIANENLSFILVKNSLICLQELARHHREQFSIPLIGLTGSNGKTTTKELIFSVLSQRYNVLATKGNLNNHIGVPLSLLQIKSTTEIALIEMGANHLNEIAFLCQLAQPTIGYITNFGKAHLEGFGSIEGVIQGKSELYRFLAKKEGTVVVNSDDSKQLKLTQAITSFSFGEQSPSDVKIQTLNSSHEKLRIEVEGEKIESHLTGIYNISNIQAAIAFGIYFNCTIAEIKHGISSYVPSNSRSEWIKTKTNDLLLDAYNANPSSMRAALLAFAQQKQKGKAVILGDMLELGDYSAEEHQHIVDLLEENEFNPIVLVGPEFSKTKLKKKKLHRFKTTDEAFAFFEENPIHQQCILLKGSRGIALEKLIPFL